MTALKTWTVSLTSVTCKLLLVKIVRALFVNSSMDDDELPTSIDLGDNWNKQFLEQNRRT